MALKGLLYLGCVWIGFACLARADGVLMEADAVDEVDEVAVQEAVEDEEIGEVAVEPRVVPTSFPDVRLAANSKPGFIAFRGDPWNKNVLYLMFDGDVTNGYNRLYVWIPGHRQYGEPQALSGSGGRFPAVNIEEVHGDERTMVSYQFQYTRQTRTVEPRAASEARTTTSTVFDYATGESRTVTRTIPAHSAREGRTWYEPSFAFSMNYQRDKQPFGGANRLALSVGSGISPADKFEQMRDPSAPWNNIHLNVSISPRRAADLNEAALSVGAGVTYGGHHRCTIEAMPNGFMDVTVNISPYLCDVHPSESPAYSQEHNAMDVMREGLNVSVPFGWYRTSWKAELHPWIGGREFSGASGLMSLGRTSPVQPGSRASAARRPGTLSVDGPPTSRLQGPPPSQLRGPGR